VQVPEKNWNRLLERFTTYEPYQFIQMAAAAILDSLGTKLGMQDVRSMSLQVLMKFGVDSSNGLEVMTHIRKQRWLLAAILNFVRFVGISNLQRFH
jgi:hypothetical protein